MASVMHELDRRGRDFTLVHTGQHYDASISDVFFEELGLRAPDLNLETGSGTHAEQTARALVRLEAAFKNLAPDLVLVEGDTNTAIATALAAVKMQIDVGHIESGVRCYDLRMPEEHNRRIADHLSAYLFAPTDRAAAILRSESCWGRIFMTGNTVIDACVRYGPKAKSVSAVQQRVPAGDFALATAHRAENVDDPVVLRRICDVFRRCPVPVVYPVHPRTHQRLQASGLQSELRRSGNVTLLPPLGYFDFLSLFMRCTFILTDSGGIQQETTAPNLRKKVFVLRDITESPEAVEAGFAEVVGTKPGPILDRLRSFVREDWTPPTACPFGKGDAGRKIVAAIERHRAGTKNAISRGRHA